mgnify:CR=1 FL=1
MFDEQEQFLLHQIRILLKQLDERQTKQKDEENRRIRMTDTVHCYSCPAKIYGSLIH